MKKYLEFIRENVESNDISDFKDLLTIINAEKCLMGDVLNVNSEKFEEIEDLINDAEFLRKLNKNDLKKNNIENSKYDETFLKDNMDIKFVFLFNEEDSELGDPKYIIFQTRKSGNNWGMISMYKTNGNVGKFYDKLSSRTIEITRGSNNYIYRTSNAGNDWTLQNTMNKNNTFKDIMSNDEMNKEIRRNNTTLKKIS